MSLQIFGQSTTLLPGGASLDNHNQNQSLTIPILTFNQISNYLNPKIGMMIFDSNTKCVRVFDGKDWNCLKSQNEQGYITCGTCDDLKFVDCTYTTSADIDIDSSGVYSLVTYFNINNFPLSTGNTVLEVKNAQLGTLWSKSVINTINDPRLSVKKIYITKKGIYLIGSFCGLVNFLGVPTLGSATPIGQNDALIIKLDKYGNGRWGRLIGGIYMDNLDALAFDENENIYAFGSYNSPNITLNSFTINNQSSSYDTFITKLDSTGNVLDLKSFGGINHDAFADAHYNPLSQEIFALGSFKQSTIYNANNIVGVSAEDMIAVKFNKNLSVISASSIGSIQINGSIQPIGFYFNPSFDRVQICLNYEGQNTLSNKSCMTKNGLMYTSNYNSIFTPLTKIDVINAQFINYKRGNAAINTLEDFEVNNEPIRNNNKKAHLIKSDFDNNLHWIKSFGNDETQIKAALTFRDNTYGIFFGSGGDKTRVCNNKYIPNTITLPPPTGTLNYGMVIFGRVENK